MNENFLQLQRSFPKPLDKLSQKEIDADSTLKEYRESLANVKKLYNSCAHQIRLRVDFDSYTRKILVVDYLPSHAKPIYDIVKGKCKIQVPTFTHHFGVVTDIKESTLATLEKLIKNAYYKIIEKEDMMLVELLDNCRENKTIELGDCDLPFAEAIKQFDLMTPKDDFYSSMVTKIIVNKKDWLQTINNLAQAKDLNNVPVDFCGSKVCRIYGRDIIPNKFVQHGRIYGVAEPEFLGVFPIEEDVRVVDINKNFTGLECYHRVGCGILAPWNVYSANFNAKIDGI